MRLLPADAMKNIPLTAFIAQKYADRGAPFATIIAAIEKATKDIRQKLARNGLHDHHGETGERNVYGEQVQHLDEYANTVLNEALLSCDSVTAIGSEELEQPLVAKQPGQYMVMHDPLDGSPNIDTNLPVGTIFSIYALTDTNSLLPTGDALIAAGYVIYGPSMILVFATQGAVNGFTFDPDVDAFVLSYPNIQIGNKKIYSINEGSWRSFQAYDRAYLSHLKDEGGYSLRYVGSVVADIHRILHSGGIFLYPKDIRYPKGKLRLFYEVVPLSFIVMQAGGAAISDEMNPLDITPTAYHQCIPIVLGNKEAVATYLGYRKQK